MDIHKKLSQTAFPKALAQAYQRKETGALVVRAGEITKNIFLENGSVIFASSNDRNDRLGEMLVRRGVISITDFLKSSERVVPGKRFGTILIETNILTAEQLVWAVKEQVKEIVFSLFGELFVSYKYEPHSKAGDEVITLNINTPELIRQGILSMDRISWALSDFESFKDKIVLSKSPEVIINLLSLSKLEQEILFILKEGAFFSDVFAKTAPSLHASVLKFLWALYVLGFVVTKSEQEEKSQLPDEILDVTFDDISGT
ncbi:MAG: hypothetical protein N2445_05110 [Acidobacteria bacterium]|nr:hypothetical protein [Acidobacteriota bacterium]